LHNFNNELLLHLSLTFRRYLLESYLHKNEAYIDVYIDTVTRRVVNRISNSENKIINQPFSALAVVCVIFDYGNCFW